MKENFNISQQDNKIFSLNKKKIEHDNLEKFKSKSTFIVTTLFWPGLVLFSLVWSFLSYGMIILGLIFLGDYIPLFKINIDFKYVFNFYAIYYVFFSLLVTTEQLRNEFARYYELGLQRGLETYNENFKWAKENLDSKEFSNLIDIEFK